MLIEKVDSVNSQTQLINKHSTWYILRSSFVTLCSAAQFIMISELDLNSMLYFMSFSHGSENYDNEITD